MIREHQGAVASLARFNMREILIHDDARERDADGDQQRFRRSPAPCRFKRQLTAIANY